MDNIHIIENVLTDDERKKLIEDSIPLLLSSEEMGEIHKGRRYPGKQTFADLHLDSKFRSVVYKMLNIIFEKTGLILDVSSVWVNLTNGNKDIIAWHNHTSDYTLVYYMKTFPFFSNGTLFEEPMGFVKAPQNSILVFPAKLRHTAPPSPFPFRFRRYTMAMDLNIVDWQAYG